MNGRGAVCALLLATAESLQACLERPPVLAAKVLLELAREGQLGVIAQPVPSG